MTPFLIRFERILIGAVLVFLIWLPLPLGSNREWSVGILIAGTGCLAIAWSFLSISTRIRQRFSNNLPNRALPMLICLLACQTWVACQWLFGLSQDNSATFQYLMLGLAYCLLFSIVVGLFQSRRHLTLLLVTLVCCRD